MLLSFIHYENSLIRLTTVTWIHEFLLLDADWIVPYSTILKALLIDFSYHEKEVVDKAKISCNELKRSVCHDIE